MKGSEILKTITGSFNKAGFKLKKHSPEILVITGVVGVVASAVMACKATTKISDILSNSQEHIDSIHEAAATGVYSSEEYSPQDAKKDLAIVYIQTGLKVAKLYAPAVAMGVLSLSGILASNNILRKRNVALAAAYATVDKTFKEYRGRVIERFGKEIDHELKYNIKAKRIEETVVDPETGKEKKVKSTVNVAELGEYSDYARFFDDGCTGWDKCPEYNLTFLRAEQNYANDRLRAHGHLFLNDVYARLGIPKTKAGQIVGWVWNPDNPNGDNYIDFGIYDVHKENSRDFVNGYEKTILLDFNVDGNILDLI